jgi:flavin-dependent dehydrogenase
MPSDLQYHVAIVGASIAGCTTAILFARNGARVALIEREGDPAAYKKICTHYIQPSATPDNRAAWSRERNRSSRGNPQRHRGVYAMGLDSPSTKT